MPDVELAEPEQDPYDRQGDFNHGGEAYVGFAFQRFRQAASDIQPEWRTLGLSCW
jgi:hypothetical protein